MTNSRLTARLEATWRRQAAAGFLLVDPATAPVEIREVPDPVSGVSFELRWLPHREIRSNVAELERRGIVNPERDETALFRDPRDELGRYCFLCADNVRQVNPLEELIPLKLAGRRYLAGVNFAWIARHHYTIMTEEHVDQDFTPHVMEALLDLHAQTNGAFRILYNGAQAGATIPWHLHYQTTSERLPVEQLAPGGEPDYPAALERFPGADVETAAAATVAWLDDDPEHHRVNLLVAGPAGEPALHVFRRDRRLTHAAAKGLIGGFEMCGELVFSEPDKRRVFDHATAPVVRDILEEVRPRPFVPRDTLRSVRRTGNG